MSLLSQLKVKIYADGASSTDMINLSKQDHIAGLTTNPTLMKAAGIKDYENFAKEILPQVHGKPISFEVFADDLKEMNRQAKKIATWGENVYVKIPVTNSVGESTANLLKELSSEKIKLNVTALFTVAQVKKVMAALDPKTPSIISVFAGRIADAGVDPCKIMAECRTLIGKNSKAELLWASTRELYNIIQSDAVGCDIITVPPDLLKKTASFGKDLEQFSLETVQMFKRDAEAAGFKL